MSQQQLNNQDFAPQPTISVTNSSNQAWINTTVTRSEGDGSTTQRSTFISKRG